jgi:hypothetical protein
MRKRLIVILVLIIVALGRVMPMTLMPEPYHPWYLPYTTTWFFIAGLIFLPSGLIVQALGLPFNRGTVLIVDAVWLMMLCLLIYYFPFKSKGSLEENE